MWRWLPGADGSCCTCCSRTSTTPIPTKLSNSPFQSMYEILATIGYQLEAVEIMHKELEQSNQDGEGSVDEEDLASAELLVAQKGDLIMPSARSTTSNSMSLDTSSTPIRRYRGRTLKDDARRRSLPSGRGDTGR